MYRIVLAITLSLSLLFLAKEGLHSLRSEAVPQTSVKTKKQVKTKDKKRSPNQIVQFYPSVPSPLPDLYEGYLFNEERFLENEENMKQVVQKAENGTELSVDIKTVFYTGSIIIGDIRKGLISYIPKQAAATTKSKITKKTPKKVSKKTSSRQKSIKYAQLVAGDSLSGYKVVSVEADRIVFQKGPETLEKMLYDSEKKRIAPPPLPKKRVTKKKTSATPSKRKQVELGKTTSSRKVQTSRKLSSSSKKSTTKRTRMSTPGLPPGP